MMTMRQLAAWAEESSDYEKEAYILFDAASTLRSGNRTEPEYVVALRELHRLTMSDYPLIAARARGTVGPSACKVDVRGSVS
jgi:hypothetical protein